MVNRRDGAGGIKMIVTRILLISFLLLPTVLWAGSTAEIPTHIQVLDQSGGTQVATPSPKRTDLKVVPQFSDSCRIHILAQNTKTYSEAFRGPFATRFESAEYRVKEKVLSLSFSPFLASRDERDIKNALTKEFVLLLHTGSSSARLEILLSCAEDFLNREDLQENRVAAIHDLRNEAKAIHYAYALTGTTTQLIPDSFGEAQYFGDRLKEKDPRILSLSLGEHGVVLTYQMKATLFGLVHPSYELVVRREGSESQVISPWWVSLFQGSTIKKEVLAFSPGKESSIHNSSLFILHVLDLLQTR
jgi:hypothetical protein